MRRIGWVVAVVALFAVVVAQNAFGSYVDEQAFLTTTNYTDRSGFIIDEKPVVNPPGFLPQSVFLSPPYLAYYQSFGFDRNFFTWVDPNGSFTPDSNVTWSGCVPVLPGQPTHQTKQFDGRLLCDPNFTNQDDSTIRSLVLTGPVHGFVWYDSNNVLHFVSTVCGNFTHPGSAPPPMITGFKFEDVNDNGVRDNVNGSLEPGLPGFWFDLSYMGQPVLDGGGHPVTAKSDALGNFTFTLDADTYTAGGNPIGPGDYQITEEQQDGWTLTTAPTVTVTVGIGSAGKKIPAAPFGNFKPTPTITTQLHPATATVQLGTPVNDSATLHNAAPDATGRVFYTSYASLNDCQHQQNGTLVGGASVKVVNGIVPDSAAITYTALGTYYWQAVYKFSGKVIAQSDCTEEAITVVGRFKICKSSANSAGGVTFNYTVVSGTKSFVVPVVGGACSDWIDFPGQTTITEDLSSGNWTVSAIDVSPPENGVSQSLGNGSETIAPVTQADTVVTYTNQAPPPRLIVCKWSSTPQLQGMTFNFTAGLTALTAKAGTSKATAGCSDPKTVTVGQIIKITETIPSTPAGIFVKSIDVSPPGAPVTPVSASSIKLTIQPGLNVVTFDNEVPTPPKGFIEVCKDAADPLVPLTPVQFTITDQTGVVGTYAVVPGQCTVAIQVAAGPVTVKETVGPPTFLANVTAIPASALGSVNLVNGTATVVVPPSDSSAVEVQVHFVNTTQTAQLKVCKVLTATSGGLAGQTFTFNLSDATGQSQVKVEAQPGSGQCVIVPHALPVGSTVTVTEAATPYVASTDPAGSVNSAVSKTVTIAMGINAVMFTNQAYGQISICKNLQGGGSGGTFTFDYAAVGGSTHGTVSVDGGTCSMSIPVPVGNYTVTEEAATGFSFVSSSAIGPYGESRVVSGANPVTVSVPYYGTAIPGGGETTITFVDRGQTATIKVCKMVDAASSASIGGYSYTFKIFNPGPNGNTLITSDQVHPPYPTTTNPNGAGPSACVLLGSYAVGTQLVVAEAPKTGVKITNISLLGLATVDGKTGNKITFTLAGPGTVVIIYTNASST